MRMGVEFRNASVMIGWKRCMLGWEKKVWWSVGVGINVVIGD